MDKQHFDEQIRLRIQREKWTPSAQARRRVVHAMKAGRVSAKVTGNGWQWCAAAACALVLAAVWMIQPPEDFTRQGNLLPGSAFVMAEGEPLKTPVPVAEPQVTFSARATDRWAEVTAVFTNHTEEIWLLTWDAIPTEDHRKACNPTRFIWLEPGASYADTASSFLMAGNNTGKGEMHCQYNAYRVTADILFWQDGPLQPPEGKEYEDQQSLLEDAFASGALLLYALEWKNGAAGGVDLLLPEAEQRPGLDPLQYYQAAGALKKGASAEERIQGESAFGFLSDGFWDAKEGKADVRLAAAEFSPSHAMLIVDFVASDRESLTEIRSQTDELLQGASYAFAGWITSPDGLDDGLWQDEQGVWHRTWQAGAMRPFGIGGETFTLTFDGFAPLGGRVQLMAEAPNFDDESLN